MQEEDQGSHPPSLITTQPESLTGERSPQRPATLPRIDTAVEVHVLPVDQPPSSQSLEGSAVGGGQWWSGGGGQWWSGMAEGMAGSVVDTEPHGPVTVSSELATLCEPLFLVLHSSTPPAFQGPLLAKPTAHMFMCRSNLSQGQISEILEHSWSLSPSESPEWLTRSSWLLACKLVAYAQHSYPSTRPTSPASHPPMCPSSEPPSPAVEGLALPPIGTWAGLALQENVENYIPDFRVATGPSAPASTPLPFLSSKFPILNRTCAQPTPNQHAHQPIDIRVHSKGRGGDGQFTSYHTYSIATASALSWFHGHVTVTRRYSDFQWLQARLRMVYPGLVLPSLPPKGLPFASRDEEFLRERVTWLELYLRGLARLPSLHTSFELQVFLSSTSEGLQAAKAVMPAAGQPSSTTQLQSSSGGAGVREGEGIGEGGEPGGGSAVTLFQDAATTAGTLVANYGLRPSVNALQSLWGGLARSIQLTTTPAPLPVGTEDPHFTALAEQRGGRKDAYRRCLRAFAALHSIKRERAKEANATAFALQQAATFLGSAAPTITPTNGPPQSSTASPPTTPLATPPSTPPHQAATTSTPPSMGGRDALGLLASASQDFFPRHIGRLNDEFTTVIHFKFVRGWLESESEVVTSRAQALEDLRQAGAQVSSAMLRHQNVLKDSRTTTSAKVAAAEQQLFEARNLQSTLEQRLGSISFEYQRGVALLDSLREHEMREIMSDLCRCQQVQLGGWSRPIRAVLDGLKPTDAEVKASLRRIGQPLPLPVLQRIQLAQNRASLPPGTGEGGRERGGVVGGGSGDSDGEGETVAGARQGSAAEPKIMSDAVTGGSAPEWGGHHIGESGSPPLPPEFGEVDLTGSLVGSAASPGVGEEEFDEFM